MKPGKKKRQNQGFDFRVFWRLDMGACDFRTLVRQKSHFPLPRFANAQTFLDHG
jgi:hypothetical protein